MPACQRELVNAEPTTSWADDAQPDDGSTQGLMIMNRTRIGTGLAVLIAATPTALAPLVGFAAERPLPNIVTEQHPHVICPSNDYVPIPHGCPNDPVPIPIKSLELDEVQVPVIAIRPCMPKQYPAHTAPAERPAGANTMNPNARRPAPASRH